MVAARADAAGLGDGDQVQGAVNSPVVAAVEAGLARRVTGPDRDRCGPSEPGVGGAGPEPAGPGRLVDDGGSAQDLAARDREQDGRPYLHPIAQLPFQRVDLGGQLTAAGDQVGGDPRDYAAETGQPGGQVIQDSVEAQAAGGDLQARIELVQVPAQPVVSPEDSERFAAALAGLGSGRVTG
jgi:hypothetical protein